MTDATLAALDALKLPLEHDIEELESADSEKLRYLGAYLSANWSGIKSLVKDVEDANNR